MKRAEASTQFFHCRFLLDASWWKAWKSYFITPFKSKCYSLWPLAVHKFTQEKKWASPHISKIGHFAAITLRRTKAALRSTFKPMDVELKAMVFKLRLLMIWESADDLRSNFGRICQQSLIFSKKGKWLTGGLNPGQLSVSPVTLPLCHQDF